jgi:hypothetical protein
MQSSNRFCTTGRYYKECKATLAAAPGPAGSPAPRTGVRHGQVVLSPASWPPGSPLAGPRG